MQRVLESFQVQAPPEGTCTHPLRREAFQLSKLSQEVQPLRKLQQSHDLQEMLEHKQLERNEQRRLFGRLDEQLEKVLQSCHSHEHCPGFESRRSRQTSFLSKSRRRHCVHVSRAGWITAHFPNSKPSTLHGPSESGQQPARLPCQMERIQSGFQWLSNSQPQQK